jgi:hypothetical protein
MMRRKDIFFKKWGGGNEKKKSRSTSWFKTFSSPVKAVNLKKSNANHEPIGRALRKLD